MVCAGRIVDSAVVDVAGSFKLGPAVVLDACAELSARDSSIAQPISSLKTGAMSREEIVHGRDAVKRHKNNEEDARRWEMG